MTGETHENTQTGQKKIERESRGKTDKLCTHDDHREADRPLRIFITPLPPDLRFVGTPLEKGLTVHSKVRMHNLCRLVSETEAETKTFCARYSSM